MWGDRIGCTNSRLERCSCIKANWANEDGSDKNTEVRPGFVEFFFRQSFQINGKQKTMVMASVKWFQSHPNKGKLGEPIELWLPNLYIPYGPSAFMPVTCICTQCCYTSLKINNETLLAILPLKHMQAHIVIQLKSISICKMNIYFNAVQITICKCKRIQHCFRCTGNRIIAISPGCRH